MSVEALFYSTYLASEKQVLGLVCLQFLFWICPLFECYSTQSVLLYVQIAGN